MRESTSFLFDGHHSGEFGIYLASTENGLFKEGFLPQRKINEKSTSGRVKPYFYKVEEEVLSFSFSFVVEWREWEGLRRQVARWLYQPYYKPLIFDSNPSKVYYAILEQANIAHNGKEGVITVNVRCDAPYGYTPMYTEEQLIAPELSTKTIKDSGTNGTTKNLKKENGDLVIANEINNWVEFSERYPTWSEIE